MQIALYIHGGRVCMANLDKVLQKLLLMSRSIFLSSQRKRRIKLTVKYSFLFLLLRTLIMVHNTCEGFVAIAAGESFAMALDIKGRLYSWGEVG